MVIREMGFNYKGYYCYLFTNSNGNYNVNIFETDDKVQAIHTLIEENAETAQNEAKEYIDELINKEVKNYATQTLKEIIDKINKGSVKQLEISIDDGMDEEPNYQKGILENIPNGNMSITIDLYDEEVDKSN